MNYTSIYGFKLEEEDTVSNVKNILKTQTGKEKVLVPDAEKMRRNVKDQVIQDVVSTLTGKEQEKTTQELGALKTPENIKSNGSNFEKFLLTLQKTDPKITSEFFRDEELAKMIPKDYDETYEQFKGIEDFYNTKMKNFQGLKDKAFESVPKMELFIKQNLK